MKTEAATLATLSRRDFQRLLTLTFASAAIPSTALAVSADSESSKGPIRLHFNENPAGLSPSARKALDQMLGLAWQYPDESRGLFHEDVAKLHLLSPDSILLGNGSSELLAVASLTFGGEGRPVVIADPTYDAMAEYAGPIGAEVKRVALARGYAHDIGKMVDAVGPRGLLYICNPNNPTGTITPKAEIRRAIENVPDQVVIVVDEAYHHYVDSPDYESVIPLVAAHSNLVVLRTFSKIYAMAGLRCGYAVAQPKTIARLRERQARNNMNVAALLAGRASLRDVDWVAASKKRNNETRDKLIGSLEAAEFRCTPSQASFFMVELDRDSREVARAMRDRGLLVGRPFPPMTRYLRVSIGTPEQMDRFVEEFGKVMSR